MTHPASSPTRRARRRAAALGALAAIGGATLVAAPAALASFPGANGKIAFVRDGDIWSVNPDGTGERRITSGPHVDGAPDWSPDGKELLFQRHSLPPAPPAWHVYRVRADGSGLTWITANGAEPDWFRDGRRIAFTRENGTGGRDLHMANRDGSGQRMIEAGLPALDGPDPSPTSDFVLVNQTGDNADGRLFASSPGMGEIHWDLPDPDGHDSQQGSWAPDGRRVAFFQGIGPEWGGETPDPKLGVAVMDAEGTSLKVVAQGGSEPAFAPDGTRIAFVQAGFVRTVRADGSDARALVRGDDPDWQPAPRPATTSTEAPAPAEPAGPPEDPDAVWPEDATEPEPEPAVVTVEAPPAPPEVRIVTRTIRVPARCAVPRRHLELTARATRWLRPGARIRVSADLRGPRPRVRLSRGLRLDRLS
jgi:Tol biopolymer transport system component